MLLSGSNSKANQYISQYPSMLYRNEKTLQQCHQCGLKFQSIRQLLNHQKRFCLNSGYDNLPGLLMKQTNKNDNRVDYKMNQLKSENIRKNNETKMKNYGQYSLGKIKYQSLNDDVVNKNSLLLYDDVMGLHKHRNNLESMRPYELKSKFSQSQIKHNTIKKSLNQFQNQKSSSAFSYKLNDHKFQDEKQTNIGYLDSLLTRNQPFSPETKQFYKSRQSTMQKFKSSKTRQVNLVNYKDNPPSQQYKLQQMDQKHSILNKSDASIANMPIHQKITYAKFKLNDLQQIKQLYLKNKGQSKDFKNNIQKMVVFYQNLLKDCQDGDSEEMGLQLSIASRPQTPILKLNDLSLHKNRNNATEGQKYNQATNSARMNNSKANLNIGIQPFAQPNSLPIVGPSSNGYHPMIYAVDANLQIAQNYAQMYYMKVMEDVLKAKSEQNRKLIEALISSKKGQTSSTQQKKSKEQKQRAEKDEQKFRFGNEIDVSITSQDRILKLLQQQQLDQLKLISKLPVNLQDQKIQSLVKNSQLRFKMQKQILKQKLQRLSWQQNLQSFEEQRQIKNNDWIGNNNKQVIKSQMKQYIYDFENQFKPPPRY